MTNLLLLCLNLQLAAVVVYAVSERVSAQKSRDAARQYEQDQLVYEDLKARLIVAGGRHQRDGQRERQDQREVVGAECANGSHEGFLS